LRVKEVRVERLQGISEDDARAEGIEGVKPGELFFNFITLWDSLNYRAPGAIQLIRVYP
jgi:hypothetical protein